MVSQSLIFTSDPAGTGDRHLVEMVHRLVPGSHALPDEEILQDFLAIEFVPHRHRLPMEVYDHA